MSKEVLLAVEGDVLLESIPIVFNDANHFLEISKTSDDHHGLPAGKCFDSFYAKGYKLNRYIMVPASNLHPIFSSVDEKSVWVVRKKDGTFSHPYLNWFKNEDDALKIFCILNGLINSMTDEIHKPSVVEEVKKEGLVIERVVLFKQENKPGDNVRHF